MNNIVGGETAAGIVELFRLKAFLSKQLSHGMKFKVWKKKVP